MKNLVFPLLLVIFSSHFAFSQSVPLDSNGKIVYSEVVQMPGMTKAKLFDRAIKAIHAMYKQADNKVSIKDPDGGLLKLNCSTQVVLKDPKTHLDVQSGFIKYHFNMYFKEGKYKYEFIGFNSDLGGHPDYTENLLPKNNPDPKRRAPEKLKYLDEDIRKLIGIMKENMSADKVETKQDW